MKFGKTMPSQATINSKISKENIKFYKEHGFLIAENLFSKEEIFQLKEETLNIFKGKYGTIDGLQKVKNKDSEFEILNKYLCIHFPHKLSKVIFNYLSHKKITNVLKKIISLNVKAVQSMLFVKAPGKPGQSWHQDEYFIPTRDMSLTGVWIAIDDAYIENGCLWVVPGSHKPALLHTRIAYDGDEYGETYTIDTKHIDKSKLVPVEIEKGGVVFFNGYLLHSSKRNKSKDSFRTSLVNHYMSAESYLPWDQDGKYELTEDLRDIVMVAGDDPYAHKGVVDVLQPYLRPDLSEKSIT